MTRSPSLNRWLVQAARHPAPVLVGLVILVRITAAFSKTLTFVAAAAAFVALLQMLRVWWRRSRILTFLLAIGLPALSVVMTPRENVHPGLFLMFVPAVLAALLDRLSHRMGGLLKAAGVPDLKPEPKTSRPGCRNLAILGGLFCLTCVAFFVWSINVPGREAAAFKQRIRPGMRLSEVVVASFSTGRHMVSVNAEEGAPLLRIGGSAAFIGEEAARTEAEVRALLDRRAPELRLQSISFMFLSAVPVRSTIRVRFGPDGLVSAVDGPFNWAS